MSAVRLQGIAPFGREIAVLAPPSAAILGSQAPSEQSGEPNAYVASADLVLGPRVRHRALSILRLYHADYADSHVVCVHIKCGIVHILQLYEYASSIQQSVPPPIDEFNVCDCFHDSCYITEMKGKIARC